MKLQERNWKIYEIWIQFYPICRTLKKSITQLSKAGSQACIRIGAEKAGLRNR